MSSALAVRLASARAFKLETGYLPASVTPTPHYLIDHDPVSEDFFSDVEVVSCAVTVSLEAFASYCWG